MRSLHSKGGIKKNDKVHQRIGRVKEKYPSVGQYYNIAVSEDEATIWQQKLAGKKTKQNTMIR